MPDKQPSGARRVFGEFAPDLVRFREWAARIGADRIELSATEDAQRIYDLAGHPERRRQQGPGRELSQGGTPGR